MEGQVNGWIGRLDCRNMRLHTLNTCFIIGLHCCHRPILWTHDRVLAVFCCHRPIPCTHDSTRATIRLKRRVVFASLPHYPLYRYYPKKRGRLISDYWSPSLYCVPRQRQLASGRFRSLRSLHPSQRLLRHRFAITCIRRVPPSNVSEGGHAFREATAACRLRSASITEISFLMLWAMATVANSAQTSRLPR